jgi:hypothetical protein
MRLAQMLNQSVARMQARRAEIRGLYETSSPDSAVLHPGYMTSNASIEQGT